MITYRLLNKLYIDNKLSVKEISDRLNCSNNKVIYWMDKHKIKRRSISDAIYIRNNPNGDSFKLKSVENNYDNYLLGLGIGLYWGEGTKASKYSIRLGNTDPKLILSFILFLEHILGVNRSNLKFGLQVFTDIDIASAMNFWCRELSIQPSQFYKPTVTISGSIGTYKKKSLFGVVTVYYNNKKLRDILISMLPK